MLRDFPDPVECWIRRLGTAVVHELIFSRTCCTTLRWWFFGACPPLPRRKGRSNVLGRFLDVGEDELEVVVVVVVVDDVCGNAGKGAGWIPPLVFHHIYRFLLVLV
jgi:hypothetical protein